MRKIIILTMMLLASFNYAAAQKQAKIEFDKTIHDFGTFSASDPVKKCTFTLTNTGDAPLIIHQVLPSCGCTVADFTKTPINPGEKGKIEVTYNGSRNKAGHFNKGINVRSNATEEVSRIYIKGDMTD